MQRRPTHGRAKVAGCLGDRRKHFQRDSTLFCKQCDQPWIWLVRGKSANGSAWNSTSHLDSADCFFHPRDRRARKRLAVELHVESAVFCIVHLDGRGVLPRTAKEEFSKQIPSLRSAVSVAVKNESAGAVAKQPAKFARNSSGSKSAAVDIRGHNGNSLRLSRTNQRLRDCKRIEQTQASAADIQRPAILAREQSRMKLRRERRIIMMRFAGGNDPIKLLRGTIRRTQRFPPSRFG